MTDAAAPTRLELQRITQREANAYINAHHRHLRAPRGYKFAIAVNDGQRVVGVITVGRPTSRIVQTEQPYTAQVTRCATDGTRNAASMLYAAAWRCARAMGYQRLITYTFPSEGGASLRAAGMRVVGQTSGGSWSRPARPRIDHHPTGQKTLWEAT